MRAKAAGIGQPATPSTPTRRRGVRTNRRDELSRADWRYLLPRLSYGRVLLLGSPRAGALEAVSATARKVLIASERPPRCLGARGARGDRSTDRIRWVGTFQDGLPCPQGSLDLVVADGSREARRFLRGRQASAELDRALTVGGVALLKATDPLSALRLRRRLRELEQRGFQIVGDWWAGPGSAETRLAFPRLDTHVARYLFDALNGRSWRSRLSLGIARPLVRSGWLPRLVPRRVVVLCRGRRVGTVPESGEGDAVAVAYLSAGLPEGLGAPRQMTPGLLAAGRYDANKVSVFLSGSGRGPPGILVKITRGARYNSRLENEFRALRRLAKGRLLPTGSYPDPLFLTYEAGLAMLGESVVPGVPLRMATAAAPDCAVMLRAIDWLIRFGDRSSRPRSKADPRLSGLVDRLATLYHLSSRERMFLDERVGRLLARGTAVPVVFEHGDAGTWNALVRPDGRVALLDWEASQPLGLPLLDLFYFLRSIATWGARRHGRRDRLAIYSECFLEESRWADVQAAAALRCARASGLDPQDVEPLFYVCWMHRALKEATWTPRPLEQGTYINLLRMCIRRHDAPALRCLFG